MAQCEQCVQLMWKYSKICTNNGARNKCCFPNVVSKHVLGH